jgi:HD-GYP domain-containing protein (c-di-GMP phosphodiesterase class II)
MLREIEVHELKIGMYVVLSGSWLSHSFLKNEFLISSEDQIKKLINSKLKRVEIDLSKSQLPGKKEQSPPPYEPNEQPAPEQIRPNELESVIHDETLLPQEKAEAVKQHSARMMKKLLDNPTAGNIQEAKRGIVDIVDLIIADDETAQYMLTITSHDYYTYTHSVNVGVLAVSLAKALFQNSRVHDLHELGAGFFLHDLGKVYVDINIINKPGKLTDSEMNQMKKHPSHGYKIMRDTGQLTDECGKIILQHHERYDGTGYPQGLIGKEIHIYGRICSIADVFDALTTERPYRKKLDPFQALLLMRNEMVHHFQKEIFEQFVMLFKG